MNDAIQSIRWHSDRIVIIDQTRLPESTVYLELFTAEQVWQAIKQLSVRGAPAIGITAAYGLVLGIRQKQPKTRTELIENAVNTGEYLKSSRPTAVNLKWAVDRILQVIRSSSSEDPGDLESAALSEAQTIHREDKEICRSIGINGAGMIDRPVNVLTHCNTGGLATGQFGTAFSVIYHAHQQGNIKHIWVDETRPLLQGARLTTWELQQAEIPFQLITDSMAGLVMQQGNVDMVIVGTDRVAANGDTANKIGTYSLAVLARHHEIPFYVAAPVSSIDFSVPDGGHIPIEERDPDEICKIGSNRIAPPECPAYNPAFDVTPADLITGIITEFGLVRPSFKRNLAPLEGKKCSFTDSAEI